MKENVLPKRVKIKRYLKKLNWLAFGLVLLISMGGALSNPNVDSFNGWLGIQLVIGLPFSILFLILTKEPKDA